MVSSSDPDAKSNSAGKIVSDVWIKCAFSFLLGLSCAVIGFAGIIHASQKRMEKARQSNPLAVKEPSVRNFYQVESEPGGASQLNVISLRFDRIELKLEPSGSGLRSLDQEDIIMQFSKACEIVLHKVVSEETPASL